MFEMGENIAAGMGRSKSMGCDGGGRERRKGDNIIWWSYTSTSSRRGRGLKLLLCLWTNMYNEAELFAPVPLSFSRHPFC